LEEGLTASDVIPKVKGLSEEGTDTSFFLQKYQNRIHTAKVIRQVSKERYGRDFIIEKRVWNRY